MSRLKKGGREWYTTEGGRVIFIYWFPFCVKLSSADKGRFARRRVKEEFRMEKAKNKGSSFFFSGEDRVLPVRVRPGKKKKKRTPMYCNKKKGGRQRSEKEILR